MPSKQFGQNSYEATRQILFKNLNNNQITLSRTEAGPSRTRASIPHFFKLSTTDRDELSHDVSKPNSRTTLIDEQFEP